MERMWRLPSGHKVKQEAAEWRVYEPKHGRLIYCGDAEGLVDFAARSGIAQLDVPQSSRRERG